MRSYKYKLSPDHRILTESRYTLQEKKYQDTKIFGGICIILPKVFDAYKNFYPNKWRNKYRNQSYGRHIVFRNNVTKLTWTIPSMEKKYSRNGAKFYYIIRVEVYILQKKKTWMTFSRRFFGEKHEWSN